MDGKIIGRRVRPGQCLFALSVAPCLRERFPACRKSMLIGEICGYLRPNPLFVSGGWPKPEARRGEMPVKSKSIPQPLFFHQNKRDAICERHCLIGKLSHQMKCILQIISVGWQKLDSGIQDIGSPFRRPRVTRSARQKGSRLIEHMLGRVEDRRLLLGDSLPKFHRLPMKLVRGDFLGQKRPRVDKNGPHAP